VNLSMKLKQTRRALGVNAESLDLLLGHTVMTDHPFRPTTEIP